MKHLFLVLSLGLASAAFAGADEFGGDIVVWPEDHGVFYVVNTQSRVSDAALAAPIQRLTADFNVDIRLSKGADKCDLAKIPAELKGMDAKGGLWIVDDPALPIALVAAEDGWGVLNVAPLLADDPDAKKCATRLQKFFFRTFANIHGASDCPMMPACVMKQANGVAEVDALVCATYSPETTSKVAGYLTKCGYKRRHAGTYYDACEEGWAPAPTNDVQKAIWDKVHQLPTKPIKILPPSQRTK